MNNNLLGLIIYSSLGEGRGCCFVNSLHRGSYEKKYNNNNYYYSKTITNMHKVNMTDILKLAISHSETLDDKTLIFYT